MHFHLRQVAIGSNDRPKHNLSFIAIEARSAGIAFDFSQSPSQQFGQPAMIDFDSGARLSCRRRLRRGLFGDRLRVARCSSRATGGAGGSGSCVTGAVSMARASTG